MCKFIQDKVVKANTVFGNLLCYTYQEFRDNDIIDMAADTPDLYQDNWSKQYVLIYFELGTESISMALSKY